MRFEIEYYGEVFILRDNIHDLEIAATKSQLEELAYEIEEVLRATQGE